MNAMDQVLRDGFTVWDWSDNGFSQANHSSLLTNNLVRLIKQNIVLDLTKAIKDNVFPAEEDPSNHVKYLSLNERYLNCVLFDYLIVPSVARMRLDAIVHSVFRNTLSGWLQRALSPFCISKKIIIKANPRFIFLFQEAEVTMKYVIDGKMVFSEEKKCSDEMNALLNLAVIEETKTSDIPDNVFIFNESNTKKISDALLESCKKSLTTDTLPDSILLVQKELLTFHFLKSCVLEACELCRVLDFQLLDTRYTAQTLRYVPLAP